MNINDLRPAGTFAKQYGVKAIVYGPPGSGKTPVINTAPNPVMLACEPGLLSMRGSNVPTYQAFTPDGVDDFFKWLFTSNESRKFDTVAIDSVSQMCDIYLQAILNGKSKSGNKVHGKAAYGEMAKCVMDNLRPLYYMPNKHAYLIAKQQSTEQGILRPYFPGQSLPVEIPHLYDAILQLSMQNVPGMGQTRAFRCQQAIDVMARDRTGKLAEYEPPDFGHIIRKAIG